MENAISLSQAIKLAVENCYLQIQGFDVGIPFIRGAPGGGKTASIHALSNEYNFGVLSCHLALKPIEETGGIPQFEQIVIDGQNLLGTVWSFPDILKKLYEISSQKEMVIWLLDDSHLLSPIHMALLYELFTERTLRGYKIPKNCSIIMAGNTSSKAGAKSLFSAIVNRVIFMPVFTDFNDWKRNYAIKSEENIHPSVLSFLSNSKFSRFFHEEEKIDEPWGSPRSWTRFGRELLIREHWNKGQIPTDICLYLASGYVGKEAGSEFSIYYKLYSEYDIQKILQNYKEFEVPEDLTKKYAIIYSLLTFYMSPQFNSKLLPNIAHITAKITKDNPELMIIMIKDLEAYEKINKKKSSLVNNLLINLQKIGFNIESILKDISLVGVKS